MHYVSVKSEWVAACINPGFVYKKYESYHIATQQDNLPFITFQCQEPFYKQKNLVYTGPTFWNSLDQSFKQSPSVFSLKRNLKLRLIKNYENTMHVV